MKTIYTLQRGNRNSNPAGWEDVITGDSIDVSRRYHEFSHATRVTDAFRAVDSDGAEWDMDEFVLLAIDDLFSPIAS